MTALARTGRAARRTPASPSCSVNLRRAEDRERLAEGLRKAGLPE
jgi:hypothetical protein